MPVLAHWASLQPARTHDVSVSWGQNCTKALGVVDGEQGPQEGHGQVKVEAE